MRLPALICSLIVIPALSSVATAQGQQDFDSAMRMMRDGDYAEAYCHLITLAERGDSRAQYSLGWMYHNGYGLRINDEKALAWWTKAATQEDPDALFALGLLYEQGMGAKKDPYRAADLFIRAARRGNEEAIVLIRNHLSKSSSRLRPHLEEQTRGEWSLLGNPQRITALKANIRNGPGKRNKVIMKLPQNTPVTRLSSKGKWVHIGIDGLPKTGWIHESILGPVPETGQRKASR